jgi:hypothetical protein
LFCRRGRKNERRNKEFKRERLVRDRRKETQVRRKCKK